MDKYLCPCGYEYDPAVGDPENGVPANSVHRPWRHGAEFHPLCDFEGPHLYLLSHSPDCLHFGLYRQCFRLHHGAGDPLDAYPHGRVHPADR